MDRSLFAYFEQYAYMHALLSVCVYASALAVFQVAIKRVQQIMFWTHSGVSNLLLNHTSK
jgi:hypothetical protein